MTLYPADPLRPRIIGAINWRGLWTLSAKEIRRFTKIMGQTVIAPLVTTLLYYLVFNVSLGSSGPAAGGLPYMAFLVPGLIMMSMAQNAFTSTSSSIVISKVQGNIVDVLMPPLSPMELVIGYTIGGIVRGLAVGAVSVVVMLTLLDMRIGSPGFVVYHAIMGSMMLALLGLMSGIWSNRFDQLAVVQNFIVMPATFLSGTFFSVQKLPGLWRGICHINPFFYMIDGFRYGFVGVSDDTLVTGLVVMAGVNAVLLVCAYVMIASGYKLRS
ncbi:MAG: ABC transporter permease [Pseudomonadota bacterium]|nr:ABC transporter permease [Pseudomonadota bacterium]